MLTQDLENERANIYDETVNYISISSMYFIEKYSINKYFDMIDFSNKLCQLLL
jgi:hypothetical protein